MCVSACTCMCVLVCAGTSKLSKRKHRAFEFTKHTLMRSFWQRTRKTARARGEASPVSRDQECTRPVPSTKKTKLGYKLWRIPSRSSSLQPPDSKTVKIGSIARWTLQNALLWGHPRRETRKTPELEAEQLLFRETKSVPIMCLRLGKPSRTISYNGFLRVQIHYNHLIPKLSK